jgi:hypothetical protein
MPKDDFKNLQRQLYSPSAPVHRALDKQSGGQRGPALAWSDCIFHARPLVRNRHNVREEKRDRWRPSTIVRTSGARQRREPKLDSENLPLLKFGGASLVELDHLLAELVPA